MTTPCRTRLWAESRDTPASSASSGSGKPGGDFPRARKFSIGWIRSHVHSLYNFLDCVYQKKTASPSFKDGAYIQHVMEKAYESDTKGAWVRIDE